MQFYQKRSDNFFFCIHIIRADIDELSRDLFERSKCRKYQVKMSKISGLAQFSIIIDIIQ